MVKKVQAQIAGMNARSESGLWQNRRQFALLVLVNALVGSMIGLERSIIPAFATEHFLLDSQTAILSFIAAFGLSKALANYFTGRLANRYGRRKLLIAGWVLALPVPLLLIWAPSWAWVVAANLLLGISQGLTWSSTVVMKIDLAGEKHRGLAMGLNEFAGYFAVGLSAWLTARIAAAYGIHPEPFYLGIFIALLGLLLSVLFVKETSGFVVSESKLSTQSALSNVFLDTSLRNRKLSAVTQAGLVNNLNDGMIWGLLPSWLLLQHYDPGQAGLIAATYPLVWGLGQLFTGPLSDRFRHKPLLFIGMAAQGLAIFLIPQAGTLGSLLLLTAILGLGTAVVYPTFLSAIAAGTRPEQRAESIGTFRLWRDLGYVFGALISGVAADAFGIAFAIVLVGAITLVSALIIQLRMPGDHDSVCISWQNFQRKTEQGKKLALIDVRSESEYVAGHIPQAVNIPQAQLAASIPALLKYKQVVVVCWKGGGRSAEAAKLLREAGINASWLCGGTASVIAA